MAGTVLWSHSSVTRLGEPPKSYLWREATHLSGIDGSPSKDKSSE